MTLRAALCVVLLGLMAFPGSAQTPDRAPQDAGSAPVAADPAEPDTPQWAQDLRRAEIVASGSFPLALLMSRFVYSLVRFTVHSVEAGAVDVNYAPWFLAPPGAPQLLFSEKLGIVGGAVGLSSIVALIDFRRGRLESDGR